MNNDTERLKKEYPLYYKTCEYLRLHSFLYENIYDIDIEIPVDRVVAEKICADALSICRGSWEEYLSKLDNFLDTTIEFLKLQRQLEKTGKYKYSTFEEVEREVFKNKNSGALEGVDYLWGLYFSRIFWIPHHRLTNFFLSEFATVENGNGICLEAPTGSGVFLSQFLSLNKGYTGVTVDISETALSFARKLFDRNQQLTRVVLSQDDIYKLKDDIKFDRIICTEFLEHVEDPVAILRILRSLLAEGGKIFLTTVTWTAFIDHIYLYEDIAGIKRHIAESGFVIEKEYIQSVFSKDAKRLGESKVALNFAAILRM